MSGVSDSITRTTEKGTCWSITLNNPSQEEIAFWNDICQQVSFVKEAKGQLEKGEQGTLHIQGMLRTSQVRFSAVKKILPRAHIELAKNALALEKYVLKEETREGELTQGKNNLLLANPQVIQKHLYDSFFNIIFDYHLIRGWDVSENRFAFDFRKRLRMPYKRNAHNLLRLLKFERHWADVFALRADIIMKQIYSDLIQRGYYNVEFIQANNLLNNAFKNNILNIIIRHARNEEARSQADSQVCQEDLQ